MASLLPAVALTAFLAPVGVKAFGSEVISEVMAPLMDEDRALEIKNAQFWQPILRAAMGMQEHANLYTEAEAAIAELSAEHKFVKTALSEALASLRRADAEVRAQAEREARLAKEGLSKAEGAALEGRLSSLAGGGGSLLARAAARLLGFDSFPEKMREAAKERQVEVFPALRGAAAETADVVAACKAASERSFDVLKYDVYEKAAAKTPAAALRVADRLADAAAETKIRFVRLAKAGAQGLAGDAEEAGGASAVVEESLREEAEAKEEHRVDV